MTLDVPSAPTGAQGINLRKSLGLISHSSQFLGHHPPQSRHLTTPFNSGIQSNHAGGDSYFPNPYIGLLDLISVSVCQSEKTQDRQEEKPKFQVGGALIKRFLFHRNLSNFEHIGRYSQAKEVTLGISSIFKACLFKEGLG